MKDIYILGVGNNTQVYIDLAESCGYRGAGLFHYKDDLTGEKIHNIPTLGSHRSLFERETLENMDFVVSVGDNFIRAELAQKIRDKKGVMPCLIHPSGGYGKWPGVVRPTFIKNDYEFIEP